MGLSGEVEIVALPLERTGMTPQPGLKRYSTTAIAAPTVDNGAYGYVWQCRIALDPEIAQIRSPGVGIIGADVTYRISSANG